MNKPCTGRTGRLNPLLLIRYHSDCQALFGQSMRLAYDMNCLNSKASLCSAEARTVTLPTYNKAEQFLPYAHRMCLGAHNMDMSAQAPPLCRA